MVTIGAIAALPSLRWLIDRLAMDGPLSGLLVFLLGPSMVFAASWFGFVAYLIHRGRRERKVSNPVEQKG